MTQLTLPPIEHPTLAGILLARADDDGPALLFEDARWSYRDLLREAAVRAALLRDLRPADRPWHVGVLLENTPEYLFLVAGAALCGATVVGINPTRRGAELAGDQVMATLKVADPPADFDVDAFAAFLGEQRDLGTTWAPRLLRITRDLPTHGRAHLLGPA